MGELYRDRDVRSNAMWPSRSCSATGNAFLSFSGALSRKGRPLAAPPYLLAGLVSVAASSGFFHNSP
jgi:hypothetical protein